MCNVTGLSGIGGGGWQLQPLSFGGDVASVMVDADRRVMLNNYLEAVFVCVVIVFAVLFCL